MDHVLSRPLSILEGPPGVGKSKVLGMAAVVKILTDPNSTGKVVVSAPSNKAVDVLLSSLISTFQALSPEHPALKDVSITIAYPNRLLMNDTATHADYGLFHKAITQNPKLEETYHQYMSNTMTSPKEIRSFWSHLRSAEESVLEKSRVIALIHHMCAKRHIVSGIGVPSLIILDENAQSTLPGSLIPITNLKGCQCIICGDRKQLGPTVLSQSARDLQESLLELLLEYGMESFFLCVQHRSHPLLVQFLSHHFYDWRIQNGRCPPGLRLRTGKCLSFIDVKSCEETPLNASSYINPTEAKVVVLEIQKLKSEFGLTDSEIGVIAPYKAQVRLLRSLINAQGWKVVTSSTVDGYQGDEKRVILVSFTRTNPESIGFVNHDRRCNVMLSRAREGLILIGNADALVQPSLLFGKLLQFVIKKECLEYYDESSDEMYRHSGESCHRLLHRISQRQDVTQPRTARLYYNSYLQWDDLDFPRLDDISYIPPPRSNVVYERSDLAGQQTYSSVTSHQSPIEASPTTVLRVRQESVAQRQLFQRFLPHFGLTQLLTLFVLFGQIFLGCADPQFQLCGHGRGGYAMRLPSQVTCDINASKTQPKVFQGDVYVPRDFPMQYSAYSCYIYENYVDTYMNVIFSKDIQQRVTRSMPLNATECQKLHETKLYRGQVLNKINEGLWATNNSKPTAFKWCCYTVRTRVVNAIIEYGHVDTRDGTTMLSNLGDAGGCRPKAGQCITSMSIIMWNASEISNTFCPYALKGTYEITRSGMFVIVEKLQVAGELTKLRAPGCLPLGTRVTRQNIFVNFHHTLTDSSEEDELISMNDTLNVDPVSGKLMKLALRLQQLETQEFVKVWTQMCAQARHTYDLLRQLFTLDATIGARAMLGRKNVSAEFVGPEIIMIWTCRPIVPQEIFWDRKYNDECFAFTPVLYNGKLMFVAPGSQDIVRTSPKLHCDHRTPSIRFEHSQYVTDAGPIHVSEFPYTLNWNASSLFDFDFSSPVLFHDEFSGQISSINILRSSQYNIRLLQQQMRRTIDYTSQSSLDPSTIANALIGFSEGIGDTMESYGHMAGEIILDSGEAVGNVIKETGETAVKVSQGLLSGLWQLIVNIIVLALVALLLVLIMYVVFRYCRAKYSRQEGTEPGDDPFHRLARRAFRSIRERRARSVEAKKAQKTVRFSPAVSRRTVSQPSPISSPTESVNPPTPPSTTNDQIIISRPAPSIPFTARFQKGRSSLKASASQEALDHELATLTETLQKKPSDVAETTVCNALNIGLQICNVPYHHQ